MNGFEIVDRFLNRVICFIIFLCGVIIGNYLGDQETFNDCVVFKEAKLFNSAKIICGIKEQA